MTVVLGSVAEAFGPQIPPRVSATASATAPPPYRGGVCGLRNAGTDTRTPASSASSAKWFVAEVAEGKRSTSTTVPNVPGLNHEHNQPRVLGGSHENALELVKTLIAFSLSVNFPANGSQTPMIPHFSNAPKFL